MSYLTIRLNAAGRSEEALNATREATEVYRLFVFEGVLGGAYRLV